MMTPNPSHHRLALALGLGVLWLALSGHYDALLLSLGLASVLLCVWICARMDVADHEVHPYLLRHRAVALYIPWLAREVVMSALDVSRRVLSRDMALAPVVIRLPMSQVTEIGRTIYANSITLTPGTVSIDVSEGQVEVHALSVEGAEALAAGEMDRRVSALERARAAGNRGEAGRH
jgi:multicomponent Na+:H+ antiporter subunit E